MRSVPRSIARVLPAAAALATALALAPRVEAQVSVGGVVYAQYQYNVAKDTLTADSAIQHINNFDITRAYISVVGRFAGGIYTRVTADVFTNGNIPGSRAFRLKYAYVAWTPDSSHLTFKIGAMHTPLLDWEEALWDYRMQGTMPLDRGSPITGVSYISSADFGVGVDGKFNADQLNFQVGAYNGENYSGTIGDGNKDIMGRVSFRLANTNDGSRVGGLRLTAYGQFGTPSTGGKRQRFLGMLSYRTMDLTLAAEFAITKDSTHGGPTAVNNASVVAAVPLRSGRVISAFGVFHFPGTRVSLVGRVDLVDPRTGIHLATLYPIDKLKNADRARRVLPSGVAVAPPKKPAGVAPLLRALMAEYAATGLPPAYLPRRPASAPPDPNEED